MSEQLAREIRAALDRAPAVLAEVFAVQARVTKTLRDSYAIDRSRRWR